MYRSVLRSAAERAKRPLALESIDHVLITHVHGDHMNGLEGAAFFKHFAQGRRLPLVTSPEVRRDLWDRRLVASMGRLWDGNAFREKTFDDYFDYTPLAWTDAIRIGPFTIRCRRTIHHVPTSALLVEAGGRTLGYSADTAFDPTLIDFLSSADLIVHETNFGPAHTPYESLAALPETLRAKMRLIHYSDGFDVGSSTIGALSEGEVVVVGDAP
jgi:ribonuclease BN (tRNA processing enzyme)